VRILVAFKVTPDFELLREADWAGAATHGVETRYVRRILNCFDESALELALRAVDGLAAYRANDPVTHPTDASDGPTDPVSGTPTIELSAVSIGGREVEPWLATLTALGFARTGRIDTSAALDFAPATVAALIAAYARRVDRSDVVLLGGRSGPGDGGTVPFRVAEELGWPCLSQVTELEALADGRLRATCATAHGLARLTLRGPCVLAVGNAVVSNLRAPTLRERLVHRDAAPGVTAASELGVDLATACDAEASALLGLEAIDRSRAAELVDGPSPQAKARTLYETRLRARLEAVRSTFSAAVAGGGPHTSSPHGEPTTGFDHPSSPQLGHQGHVGPAPSPLPTGTPRFAAVIDATGEGERAAAACARQAGALGAFLRDGLTGELAGETIIVFSDGADAERLVELAPTREVRLVRAPPRRPDLLAAALAGAVREHDVALVLAAAGTGAVELATRLACRTRGAVLTDALDLEIAAGRLCGHAAVYSGHLRGRFELSSRPWCVTLDAGWNDEHGAPGAPADHVVLSRSDAAGDADDAGAQSARAASAADGAGQAGAADGAGECPFTDLELLEGPPGDDLADSRFLVVAGYGAGDRAGLERIAQAARRLGADFGVSRPVVMNAWAPADRLIGVSGSRAAPELCIVVGASGAPALFWGIERAGLLVAVNPDELAPIARNADVVVRDDGVAVIEALAALVARDGD